MTDPSQQLDPEPRPQRSSAQRADGSAEMFDAIASRYDLLNRLMSMGIDRRWRRLTARSLELSGAARVLDLATGTADLAIEIARWAPAARVAGVDPSPRMLGLGARKIERAGLARRISLLQGDARDLPFADRSFSAVTIAFGIRNVPDRARALREIARVVEPEGRIAILELSEPKAGMLARLSSWYVHKAVPMLGRVLSGPEAYRYLERSIEDFPTPREFARQMSDAGIEVEGVRSFTFGACQLFIGRSTSAIAGLSGPLAAVAS